MRVLRLAPLYRADWLGSFVAQQRNVLGRAGPWHPASCSLVLPQAQHTRLSGPPWLGQDSWLGSQRTGSLSGSAGACCVTLREPLSSLVLNFPCTRRHSALRCPQPFRCPSTFTPNSLTMGSHDAFIGTASQLGRLALGAQKTY